MHGAEALHKTMPRGRDWMGCKARGSRCNNAASTPPPAQRARADAMEREQELLQQEQAEVQQKLEEQRRSHEEHVRQLEETLQREQKALLEELDRTMAQKLQVRGQEGIHAVPQGWMGADMHVPAGAGGAAV